MHSDPIKPFWDTFDPCKSAQTKIPGIWNSYFLFGCKTGTVVLSLCIGWLCTQFLADIQNSAGQNKQV